MTTTTQTTLTEDELEAFDALEEIFGETDHKFNDLSRGYDYGSAASNELKIALRLFAAYKVQSSTDWEEIDRKAAEERQALLIERTESIRDTVVTGALTAAVVKTRKLLPNSLVSFDVDEDGAMLEIALQSGEDVVVVVDYDSETNTLTTVIEDEEIIDQVDVVDGSQSPRVQFTGIDALYKWLEEGQN